MSTVFYDNTVQPSVGDDLLNDGVHTNTQGQSFSVPAGIWTLNGLKLTLRRPSGAGNGQITINLYADNGAAIPVTLIQNLTTAFVIAFPDNVSHLFPIVVTPTKIAGGARYWIFCDDLNNTGTAWRTCAVLADGEFNAGMNSNAYLPTSDAVNGPTLMQISGDPFNGVNLGPSPPRAFNTINMPKLCCPRKNPRGIITFKCPVMKRGR